MKYVKSLNEFNENKNIICYHRSNEYEHMVNNQFNLELAKDVSMFGHAIYFTESPDISKQLGKYICKFSINLKEPCLDMNKPIRQVEAEYLINKFNKMFNKKVDLFLEDIEQIGDIFDEINDRYYWDYAIHYKDFIQSLGFKSFKYYSNYHTDFMDKKGDYGRCYGVYDTNDIKFVDGPF